MDAWGNEVALYLLLGLLPLLVGVVWTIRARRRAIRRLGPGADRLARDFSLVAVVGRGALIVLGFALLVVAVARPMEAGESRPARARGIDVVLALDISKSMLAQDVRPSRIERAKAELGTLARELRGHRIALVGFAGAAFVQCPLTTDVDAARLFLRALNPRDMPVPGTSLSRALSTALDLLKDVEGKSSARGKAIILLTDGEGHDEDPLVEAKLAKERKVVIHTVGIGTAAGGPIPEYDERGKWIGWKKSHGREVLSTLNTKLLEKIARTTGGKFFHVGPGGQGMKGLTDELKKLSKGELEADVITEYQDRYEWFLLPAFLIFLAEAVLADRRRRALRAASAPGGRR